MASVMSDLTASDTYTDWIKPVPDIVNITLSGFLDLVITGTWAGTLTIQKRHEHGGAEDKITYTTPAPVQQFNTNGAQLIEDHSQTAEYRVGFLAGDFTSGSANVRLEQ